MSFRDRYFDNLEANVNEALDLMVKKNSDYAKEHDPFQNFRDSAKFAGITIEQGILVRLGDKFTRYRNLVEKGTETGAVGESIMDTLLDAMNYTNILKTWHDMSRPSPEDVEFDNKILAAGGDLPPFDLDATTGSSDMDIKKAYPDYFPFAVTGQTPPETKTIDPPKIGTKEWLKGVVNKMGFTANATEQRLDPPIKSDQPF